MAIIIYLFLKSAQWNFCDIADKATFSNMHTYPSSLVRHGNAVVQSIAAS